MPDCEVAAALRDLAIRAFQSGKVHMQSLTTDNPCIGEKTYPRVQSLAEPSLCARPATAGGPRHGFVPRGSTQGLCVSTSYRCPCSPHPMLEMCSNALHLLTAQPHLRRWWSAPSRTSSVCRTQSDFGIPQASPPMAAWRTSSAAARPN